MTTAIPDPELNKRKRRRSARAYINLAQLSPEQIAERLEVLQRYFPSDSEEDAQPVKTPKKPKKSKPVISDDLTSGQAMVAGYQGHMSPDRQKAKRQVGQEARIPVSSLDQRPAEHAQLCTVAGCSGSTEPAGGMTPPDGRQHLGEASRDPFRKALEFAASQSSKGAREWSASADVIPHAEHVNYQQQPEPSVAETILSRLRTNQEASSQQASFHSWTAETDTPQGAPGNVATVRAFDAAAHAGSMTGVHGRDVLNEVQHAPAVRDTYGIARNSGTPATPGHSLADPCSHAVSNKSRLDIIRDAMREQGLR